MFKKQFEESEAYKLLKEAFTLESFASLRFKLFANIAGCEGLPAIEKALNELARSQDMHAICHFNLLRNSDAGPYSIKVGNTVENLKTALSAEVLESDEYVGLIKAARREGLLELAEAMEEIALAEVTHIHRLNTLINDIVRWS